MIYATTILVYTATKAAKFKATVIVPIQKFSCSKIRHGSVRKRVLSLVVCPRLFERQKSLKMEKEHQSALTQPRDGNKQAGRGKFTFFTPKLYNLVEKGWAMLQNADYPQNSTRRGINKSIFETNSSKTATIDIICLNCQERRRR